MIDIDGIINIIDSLANNSSCGVDNINSKLLKNTKVMSSLFLLKIFQQSLDTGVVPDEWKVGKVIPVHKGGDKNKSSNYRPISLTSIPAKILEHVVFHHVITFLESNNILPPFNTGFESHSHVNRNYSALLTIALSIWILGISLSFLLILLKLLTRCPIIFFY